MKTMHTSESTLIRIQIGNFLCENDKYDDSEKLILQAMKIYAFILEIDHSIMLSIMHNLIITYQTQSRNVDAIEILKQMLKKSKRILREEHSNTLSIMHVFALTS